MVFKQFVSTHCDMKYIFARCPLDCFLNAPWSFRNAPLVRLCKFLCSRI